MWDTAAAHVIPLVRPKTNVPSTGQSAAKGKLTGTACILAKFRWVEFGAFGGLIKATSRSVHVARRRTNENQGQLQKDLNLEEA